MNSIPETEIIDVIPVGDLSIIDAPASRFSGSSTATGSSASSISHSPISSECSMGTDSLEKLKAGIRRLQSNPTKSLNPTGDDEYYSSDYYYQRMSTLDLPEVFEEELDDQFDNNKRSRHDSGIVTESMITMKSKRPGQKRQRYNSSSIRRTQATYVSELIERRGSVKLVPPGPSRDDHCIRSALKFITDPLNVLVVGPHDSGKTTLINSLLMSVTGAWSDRAPYGIGRQHNLSPVVLYENPDHHKRCRTRSDNTGPVSKKHHHFDAHWKRAADDPCGRVVMWDTRGFHKIYDENHQALLLRYILEGRLLPQNLQQALLLDDYICKKRYRNVVKDNQIDLVLYVASASQEPDLKLFRAIQKAKLESKDEKARNCPVLLSLTKLDMLPTIDQNIARDRIVYYHPECYAFFEDGEFKLDDTKYKDDVLWSEVHCYDSEISPVVDETKINEKDLEKDKKLLRLFKDIINLSLTPHGKKRTYSTSSKLMNLAKNTGSKIFKTGRTRTISV